jgi:hypothetical protein
MYSLVTSQKQLASWQFGYILEDLGMELLYILAIWNILRPLGTFYGHLVILHIVIWYIFPRFGTLFQEKSSNPGGVVASVKDFRCNFVGSNLGCKVQEMYALQ